MDADPIRVRCSQLPRWTSCEKGQMHKASLDNPPAEVTTVAAWIGSAVHAELAEQPIPDPPGLIAYDRVSPSIPIARRQIKDMVVSLRRAFNLYEIVGQEITLDPLGDSVIELTGTLDVLLRDPIDPDHYMIVDIKTGMMTDPAWLQLGAYAMLAERGVTLPDGTVLDELEIKTVGIAHCTRQRVPDPERIVPYSLKLNDAASAIAEARKVWDRIVELYQDPELAYAAPGWHCTKCTHRTCIIRTHDYTSR